MTEEFADGRYGVPSVNRARNREPEKKDMKVMKGT